MPARQPHRQAFEAVVVGSGQIGRPLAVELARAGLRTALIQGAADRIERAGPRPPSVLARAAPRTASAATDADQLHRRRHGGRRHPIERLAPMNSDGRTEVEGLTVLHGEPCFDGAHSLLVRGAADKLTGLAAPSIFLNTGSRVALPCLPGLSGVPYLTERSAWALDEAPADLLVLGGSYPGVELAQRFRRLGTRVTIIEKRSQLLPREDRDIAAAVAESLRADGIEIFLESEAIRVSQAGARTTLKLRTPLGERELNGSRLLVVCGHTPNTGSLDLPAAGIDVDANGYVKVNERLETTVAGVYALGVINGGPAFNEVAYDDFRVIRTNLIERAQAAPTRRIWPYLAFLQPQLGRIGLTESQAREQGRDIKVAKLPMNSVARAIELSETRGLMKVLVDSASRRILGAAVLGLESRQIVAILQIAMMADMPYTALRDSMSAHPALSGTLDSLFAAFRI